MNFSAEIKSKICSSVVSVKCGNAQGTAFFISSDILLTARHIIVDYIESKHAEEITVNVGKQILCIPILLADEGDNVDVILLKCNNLKNHSYLNLLSANFNEETKLAIVGYPTEFGHCSDLISLDVRNRINVKNQDYDTTVVRSDALSFTTYKGFSGSPVINEKGSVVGVVLKQQNQGISYLSIEKLSPLLEKKQITVNKDWQNEDFSPLGRGTSQRQVADAVLYASIRYNRDLHIANSYFDKEIDIFSSYKRREEIQSKLKDIETKSLKLYGEEAKTNTDYKIGEYNKLPIYMRSGDSKDQSVDFKAKNFYNTNYPQLSKLIDQWNLTKEKRIVITANAGYGKTHYMCAIAERLSKNKNVYLLFGSRFTGDKEFQKQLQEMMHIGDHTLIELNHKMKDRHEITVIIIDAINEGADDAFWQRAKNIIENDYNLFENIKFIITFRINESKVDFSKWHHIKLTGFDGNVNSAIDKYFEHYKISYDNTLIKKHKSEFNEPLFLSIFCQVFEHYPSDIYNKLTYSILFRLYIYFRNSTISVKVDEDPHRNVTYKYLDKLASYSLYYKNCQDIPRDKARHYADQICRNRKWSESLLYWTLRENLLLETRQNGDSIMFGFQKMGDFLMADVFDRGKMKDEDKIKKVIELSKLQSYRRFISALLTDWKLTPELLNKPYAYISNLMPMFLESLKNHGLNYSEIIKWLEENCIVDVHVLRDYFSELPIEYFNKVHDTLLKMKLADRDEIWSSKVNELYLDSAPYAFGRFIDISITNNEDNKKIIILLCWLSTSSHPAIRSVIVRKLVLLFESNNDLVEFAVTKFSKCNDPYVIQVITCAIYGCLLRKRDKELTNQCASVILKHFYREGKAPNDIVIRQWTLLIFQFADYLNNTETFRNAANPPFKSESPYEFIRDHNIEGNYEYFGKSNGSKRMYETLYGFSDFRRYILRTNSSSTSNVFFSIDEKGKIKEVLLKDIQTMIANIAKYKLGWSDKLGEFDKNIYSQGRYNNKIERFGKKYLWLALFQLDALMSDNFKMVDSTYYHGKINMKDIAKIPYPWYTGEYSHIDPSVTKESDIKPESLSTTNFINVDTMSNENWLKADTPIDNPRLLLGDNREWVVLSCYDGYNIKYGNFVKDFFLFSNAAFVKNENLETYNNWAKKQNFYGRWMPEYRNGSIAHLWNECPWADTYKRTKDDEEYLNWQEYNCPVPIILSYESQLQEEWGDLDENKIKLREAAMPNCLLMDHLRLYTAERGIIRDLSHPEIKVAVNFEMDQIYGLAIRHDYLDKYLNDMGYSMVYYTLGEKYIHRSKDYYTVGPRYDLSGAYYYNNDKIETVQPMHITDAFPKK